MASTTLDHRTHSVGIDISKQTLDCWLRPAGEHLRCQNEHRGFRRLHQWLTAQGCQRPTTVVCLENTGMYGKRLLMALTQRGWACAVEKTTVTDRVGPEHHRKDDPFEARLLAEYADRFTDQLQLSSPPEPALDRMQQLLSDDGWCVSVRPPKPNKPSPPNSLIARNPYRRAGGSRLPCLTGR